MNVFLRGIRDLRSALALALLSVALSVAPQQEKVDLARAIQDFTKGH
jgi:hypothetical protein